MSSPSSLFCSEDAADIVSCDADTWISHSSSSSSPPSLSSLSTYSCSPSDQINVDRLINSEPDHMPDPDYVRRCRDRSVDVAARQDSINWILKLHAHYHFSPVTAFLSVNYFDRFLSFHSLPQPNGWPFHLLSVACLSLAAKMEEPQVPLLLDLQVFESKYVFEPKTVQRMELSVMATLNWRLRSVTPFDFIDYFISKLPPPSSTSSHDFFIRVFSASSDLILSTTRAAAVLCAAGEFCDNSGRVSPVTASFHERVNKEMVRSCHQLMEEYLIDTCPAAGHKRQRVQPAAPPSPVGVLDAAACGSCDTRSETAGSTSQVEPPPKRQRSSAPDVQQQ
ncbi:hypothetical protein FEM48_Zijuj09G0138800 [Ziziphus jujuba var. spinosa]|uniref:B-like cyclin n=1 Tax=Ziziphus jujuba var. spinosa TaxID=714518 RepID=A0A978UTC6_ZIZJJ|nr:hypothetical protein FEM48_Zijuj09G0138800 [Ziziphus jujuba var. spinosa]